MNPLALASHPNFKPMAYATVAGILALIFGMFYWAYASYSWAGVGAVVLALGAAFYALTKYTINKYNNIMKTAKGNLATDLIAATTPQSMALSKEEAEKLVITVNAAKSNFTRSTKKKKPRK